MKAQMLGCVVGLLLCVSFGNADLVSERKREDNQSIAPYSIRSYIDSFKGGKRALVIASGKGRTCLGLYVYDEHGNCVARDDVTSPETSDDLMVEWVPLDTARFDVEILNVGADVNSFQMALR